MSSILKFIDIGANLTDLMYQGVYHGSKKHNPDLDDVLKRAWDNGVEKIMVTGGSLEDSKKALELAKSNDRLYSTVGCHPTRCKEFDDFEGGPDAYLNSLRKLILEAGDKVVALGEMGLDYDRLEFCASDIQKRYFEKQLGLAESVNLPLFLHCRNSASDLVEILTKHKDNLVGGVVHSFDGSYEDAEAILDLGYFIGINGCSLKTESNLEVVKKLPVDRIMLETDCPWCEVRPSHAGAKFLGAKDAKFEMYPSVKKEKWKSGSMIKSRNEPCNIRNLLKIIATLRGEEETLLGEQIFQNTSKAFFKGQ